MPLSMRVDIGVTGTVESGGISTVRYDMKIDDDDDDDDDDGMNVLEA